MLLLLRRPKSLFLRISEIRFYRRLFVDVGVRRIFDIGANNGNKSLLFSRFCRSLVSVEPDPDAAASLRVRFSDKHHVKIVEAGVSDLVGEAALARFESASAYNTFSDKWKTKL